MGVPLEMKLIARLWSHSGASKPAIFLDRDGTLIEHRDIVADESDLQLLSGVSKGLRILKEKGFLLILVSNQPNIEKGIVSAEATLKVTDHLQALLDTEHAGLDAAYYCPHRHESGCACRKPALGMLDAAKDALAIDMSKSWLVGDTGRDMETAHRAGLFSVRVQSLDLDAHYDTPGGFMAETTAKALEMISARIAL